MSGIRGLLKRLEKYEKERPPKTSTNLSHRYPNGLFSPEQLDNGGGGSIKDEEKKIRAIEQRISRLGIADLGEQQMRYALRSKFAGGDSDKAVELLMILEDSATGILRDYKPSIKLLGAENRQYVTCYLDALLFAMFARLDCFEAILFNTFTDEPRQKLALVLRLWVNMLRSGVLITTDITRQLQESLSECGWTDAAQLRQQDASEAFTFITEKLELPLLTLKMDIYHTGREDVSGDHKFINERLLEVAIPPDTGDGKGITLEDCLETYFNNRIEVKRYLNRRTTMNSLSSFDSTSKGVSSHVEELSPSQLSTPTGGTFSPVVSDTITPLTTMTENAPSPIPSILRRRTTSIVQERFVPERDSHNKENYLSANGGYGNRGRKGSIRKEVMMPAWQMFSLIPWYTDNTPTSDAQVAAHFSSKRPILGMCLKRYSMLPNGRAARLSTYIDIPIEIGLPHFIQDDQMKDEGPLYGNFKLSLQAVVCHRGDSVDSGHYISLVRGTAPNASAARNSSSGSREEAVVDAGDHWMRFDDLASERITLIDIEQALKSESPYLLFYQILPIEDTDDHIAPSSVESERLRQMDSRGTPQRPMSSPAETNSGTTKEEGPKIKSSRPSLEITVPDTARVVDPTTRQTVTYSDSTANEDDISRLRPGTSSTATTPKDEDGRSSFSFSRRGSRRSKGSSNTLTENQSSENRRISSTISRAASRMSREKLRDESNDRNPEEDTGGKDIARSRSRRRSEKGEKPKQLRKQDRSGGKEKQRQKNGILKKPDKPDRECAVM